MSYCPRASTKTSQSYTSTPGTKTVTGGSSKAEDCGAVGSESVVSDPGTPNESTSTTTYIPGPPGPTGKDGIGFHWTGEWAISEDYKTASDTYRFYDVVFHNGASYIATADNRSDSSTTPEHEPGVDTSVWNILADKGTGIVPAEKDFIDQLKSDVFDWIKNASFTDLLTAAAIAAGIIWAGSKIVSMFTDDGHGDGNADSRYQGTLGYVTTSFVAPDIKAVIGQLCQVADQVYDVSTLPNESCSFVIGQQSTIRSVLEQLSLGYQFDMVDSAGTYRFVPRSATPVKTLSDLDVGFSAQVPAPVPWTTKRFQGIDLPRSVTVTYISPDNDYGVYTQVANLPTYQEGQDITLDLSIGMSDTKGKQIAEIALIQSHVERTQYVTTVNYNQFDLECGDIIATSRGNIRITTISESNTDGTFKITGVDAGVAESIQTSNLDVAVPPASKNIPVLIGYSQALWIDPTALDTDPADTGVRLFAAVHGFDADGWPGAGIYVSENGGSTYDQIGTAFNEATVGLVEVATPNADYYIWDESTVITVKVKTNSLASVAYADVVNGKNWAQIGQEIIGFRNATLVAAKTYQLSGLLRGRRGTEQFVSTHAANELFCMLDSTLTRLTFVPGDRNSTLKFKVVTNGSSIDKVTAEDVKIASNNLRLWTIAKGKLLKVGSDFQASWIERVRYLGKLKDNTELTHDDDWGGYGIIVYDTDGVTTKKTYTTTSNAWTYTSAMQFTDFGSAQSTLKIAVAPMSQLGVSGYPTTLNS